MSGLVGVLHLDGRPIQANWLNQATHYLKFRGPDAQHCWSSGPVGLGHALLRTEPESAADHQPASLDSRLWITADVRLDARQELIARLAGREQPPGQAITDAELILRAYESWGRDCLDHLQGDFAFAIWDARDQVLFCARDRLGLKPFYYARVGDILVFSNTLDCVRRHPAVSGRLHEPAVGDFLLAGYNPELDTTIFTDIRRLPPAHSLTAGKTLSVQRYWSVPRLDLLHYRRPREYVEHFQHLLDRAVADRVRGGRAGVFMSGGLDSPTVAASARQHAELQAFTVVYDHLIPDQERYYAGLVARALSLPIRFLPADGYQLYERRDQPELFKPEPYDSPLAAAEFDHLQAAGTFSRVVLNGEGPDMELKEGKRYFIELLRQLQLGEFLRDASRYAFKHRRLPPFGILSKLKRRLGMQPWTPPFPPWFNPEFARTLDLPARAQRMWGIAAEFKDLDRREAYQTTFNPLCCNFFEWHDPGFTRVPVEVRFPFFDLRMVQFLLALPSMPWCVDKELLRAALRGTVPGRVLQRPKTPLEGDPVVALLSRAGSEWVDRHEPHPELPRYVNPKAVPSLCGEEVTALAWMNSRPLTLSLWLQQRDNHITRIQEQDDASTRRAEAGQETLPAASAALLRGHP